MAEINANWLAEAVEHSEEYKRLEAENQALRNTLQMLVAKHSDEVQRLEFGLLQLAKLADSLTASLTTT